MSSKLSPAAILADQVDTWRDHRTGRLSLTDVASMVGIPLAVGGLMFWRDLRVIEFGQVLAGVAILTGFAFGLLVFVFQLRLESRRDGSAQSGGILAELLNELFTNLAYACVVGLALVTLTLVVGALGPVLPTDAEVATQLGRWPSAIVSVVGVHFLLTLLMCLKRTYLAFDRTVRHA